MRRIADGSAVADRDQGDSSTYYGAALYCPVYYELVLSGLLIMSRHRRCTCVVLFFHALLLSSAVLAADVTVFAAASLKEAMDELGRQFGALTGNKVINSFAASNALAKQIESGAPADIFMSADLDWMDYLDQRHLLMPRMRVDLLRNTLVLIEPAAGQSTLKIARDFKLSVALGSQKLAMANPDSVPAGKYGKSALEALGVWSGVAPNIVRADNVRAALVFVSRGEAAFGIVYRTDALADKGVRIVDTFPVNSHPAIVYPAAVVAPSKSTAAQALFEYLRSSAAGSVWQRYGFELAR